MALIRMDNVGIVVDDLLIGLAEDLDGAAPR